jgi:hypothetical protein
VDLYRFCELICRPRFAPEKISDIEACDDVDRLDDEGAGPDEVHDSRHPFPFSA